MLDVVGLAIIIAGWIVQISYAEKGEDRISREFLFLYAIGVALLSIDGFMKGLTVLGILNLACFAPSMMLLFVIAQRKQAPANNAKVMKH